MLRFLFLPPTVCGYARAVGNHKIARILDRLGKAEKDSGDAIRANVYKKAAASIRGLPQQLTCGKDALAIKGIGPKIGEKIDKIIATGTLPQYEAILADPRAIALDALSSVHGVGPVRAQQLWDKGVTTVVELQAAADRGAVELVHAEQVGLRHHGDFAVRIPRAEMDRLANRMLATAAKLDKDLKVMICGSYRRGLPDSGDIDVLLSHSHYTEGSKGKNPLGKFVTALTPGVITDTLSKGNKKFQGVCRLDTKSPFRRLDIMVTTAEEYWPGISYFTGSGSFNRALRLRALEKGFTLNEHGLYNQIADPAKPGKLMAGARVLVDSEEAIFDALGVRYYAPKDREFGK